MAEGLCNGCHLLYIVGIATKSGNVKTMLSEPVVEANALEATRSRGNNRGTRTREAIVEAAVAVVLESGYANFSLQAVTSKLGISLGNLTYHFRSRNDLVFAMVERLVASYERKFEDFVRDYQAQEVKDVGVLLDWLFSDTVESDKSRLLPELWAMANHHEFAARALERLYSGAIDAMMRLMGLEPYAPANAHMRCVLYLVATAVEGATVMFGRRQSHDERFITTRQLAREILSKLVDRAMVDAELPCVAPGFIAAPRS